ncbi:MAG: hypothetical protein ACK4HV_05435, partial [Parachlamydiaceae bacterium]
APKFSTKQKSAYRANTEMQLFCEEQGHFITAFFKESRNLSEEFPELTQPDLARLLFVATYAAYPDNGESFSYLKHNNGIYINKKTLDQLLGMSRNPFNAFYNKLIDCGILEEVEGKLAINPRYFVRGDIKKVREFTSGLAHTRVFRGTIRNLYQIYNGRQIKKLGLIYAVLPHINLKTNIVAHNPLETTTAYIEPMTLGTLADKLGYKDANKLKQAMRATRLEDQPVFQFVEDDTDARKKKVIVNPRVLFASNTESLEAVIAMFNKAR